MRKRRNFGTNFRMLQLQIKELFTESKYIETYGVVIWERKTQNQDADCSMRGGWMKSALGMNTPFENLLDVLQKKLRFKVSVSNLICFRK
jgi:hypothetical protein